MLKINIPMMRISMQQRSDVIFPVTKLGNKLRTEQKKRVRKEASVFLACSIEFMVREILFEASASVQERQRKRIQPRDLLSQCKPCPAIFTKFSAFSSKLYISVSLVVNKRMFRSWTQPRAVVPGAGVIPSDVEHYLLDTTGGNEQEEGALQSPDVDIEQSPATPRKVAFYLQSHEKLRKRGGGRNPNDIFHAKFTPKLSSVREQTPPNS